MWPEKFINMAIARTANPALNKKTFTGFAPVAGSPVMTLSGTVNKIFILLFAYRSGMIKPTENFKLGVFAATGGVVVLQNSQP